MLAGARSATHTFNAMRAIDHREPGLAAYVLDKRSLFAEIICDGIHVDPMMVRLLLQGEGRGPHHFGDGWHERDGHAGWNLHAGRYGGRGP